MCFSSKIMNFFLFLTLVISTPHTRKIQHKIGAFLLSRGSTQISHSAKSTRRGSWKLDFESTFFARASEPESMNFLQFFFLLLSSLIWELETSSSYFFFFSFFLLVFNFYRFFLFFFKDFSSSTSPFPPLFFIFFFILSCVSFSARLNQISNVDRHLFDCCVIMLFQFLQCTTISVGNKVNRNTLTTKTSTTTDSRMIWGNNRNFMSKQVFSSKEREKMTSSKREIAFLTYEYSSHEH